MKNLLISILISPLLSFSQLNTGISFGWDTHGRAVSCWSVGCTIKQIVEVNGEIRPSITRSVFMNNYMGGRIGLHLLNPDQDNVALIMGAGYLYNLRSQDKIKDNSWYWATFVKTYTMINDNGGISFEAMYLNNSAQFSLGIHYQFTKRERLY